jgi:hypothetical protein
LRNFEVSNFEQACDLEADVVPTVARTVPELPRPLKRWGAAFGEPESPAAYRWPARRSVVRVEFISRPEHRHLLDDFYVVTGPDLADQIKAKLRA